MPKISPNFFRSKATLYFCIGVGCLYRHTNTQEQSMSTALDTDIATLVGEMPAVACESISHDTSELGNHEGDATHYAHIHHRECGLSVVKAYCGPFVDSLRRDIEVLCNCYHMVLPSETVTILGPVGSP